MRALQGAALPCFGMNGTGASKIHIASSLSPCLPPAAVDERAALAA